jgi:CO/xanthine dehydrogenase FAD-binding subunit
MLPNEIQWYFPTNLNEAIKLINQQGVILHAGGTRILKTQTQSIKGLVDIDALKLNYIRRKNKVFHIGAGVTFGDIVKYSRQTENLKMLEASLSKAASTPLRNRITIGGSIKDFPLWSSLYAPLIALDAKINLIDKKNYTLSIEEYVTKGIIKTKHIIKEIIVPSEEYLKWGVKRFSLIRFEYPLFNIAVSFQMNEDIVRNAKLVITGVHGRFKRFKKAENIFAGEKLSQELIEKAGKFINPKFISDYKYSANYKEKIAKVYFKDVLTEIAGRK